MSVFSLCGIALCCCAASLILRSVRPEYAFAAETAGAVIFLFAAIGSITPIIKFLTGLSEQSSFSSYYTILLKAMGIAFLTNAAAEICRGCGENGTAGKIEMIGKISIIALSLPIVEKLLETAKGLIT